MHEFGDPYRILFESNPLPMWVYDLQTLAFLAVNDAAVRHYGYSREEFLSMTIADIRPVEDVPRLKQALAALNLTRRSLQNAGVWRHRRKDGTIIDVEISSQLLHFQGRDARLVLAHDVTVLRRSTEQLHLLEACVEHLNDVVIITEAEPLEEPGPRIIFVNDAFEKHTGYSRREAIGRSPRFLQGLRTSRAGRKRIRRALEACQPVREEIINYTKSGKEIWLEMEIAPVIDETGRTTHFVSIERDVTERKREEKVLQESEARLTEAQRVAHVGSWEWNVTDRVVTWSDEMYRIFGLPHETKITAQTFLNAIHPQEREIMARKIEDMRTRPRALEEVFRIVHPDGTIRHMLAHGEARVDVRTGKLKIVGTTQDITERKQAEEDRLRTAKLEAANRELEAFSYSVSHDLRAPLRTIDGFSKMLAEDYSEKLDEMGRTYLEYIQSATHRMTQLIQDLLELAQITSSEIRRMQVDLSALAETILGELRRDEPGRTVETNVAPGLSVNADPRLLRVVLDNLLGNAWKFTGKTPAARIELGAEERDGEPVFFIRDNGAGFDMQFAQKLFRVFQRLHREAEFTGTGVGLATVQRIISRHGGRIWAEAAPDRGATFYFTLPSGAPESQGIEHNGGSTTPG